MAGEWLVRLANFENLNIVLLLNFIFVSENHITVVAVFSSLQCPLKNVVLLICQIFKNVRYCWGTFLFSYSTGRKPCFF